MSVYALDPLRDVRHSEARAARDLADWLGFLALEGKADRTRKHYAYTALDLAEAFPEKGIEDFSDGDIMALLRGYPQRSLGTRCAHLASLFGWAKRTRRIAENPMEYVPRPKVRRSRIPDIFTEAEESLLCSETRDGRLMTILFSTAIRKSEARHLQRKHISLGRGELVIYQGKGSKDRIIPLMQHAKAAIADMDLLDDIAPDDFLWYCRPGGGTLLARSRPTSDGAFARWFRRVVEDAGVAYRKPHMTRHTCITRWRLLGLDLDEIQILAGHASIQTTSDLYSHLTVHDVARRMAEIEAGL